MLVREITTRAAAPNASITKVTVSHGARFKHE